MKGAGKGFTLVELLVVIGIMAILAALSAPAFVSWLENARYRSAAREIFLQLREARALAISRNLDHRIRVDLPNNRYGISPRLCKNNSSAPAADGDPRYFCLIEESGWIRLPNSVALKSGENCGGSGGIVDLPFRPNGTSSIPNGSEYICIMEAKNPSVRRFRVGISSAITGRIVLE